MYIANCILYSLEQIIYNIKCYYIRLSTVVTKKKRELSSLSLDENLQFFDASSFMPVEQVRKPQNKPAPYACKPGPKGKHAKNISKTSAKSVATKQRNNFTL